ncbi:transcription antitermination factor NusB [Gangjinia marincola]|uniref:Transcription antitermination factor NusB n=1 Tax=Gangjinia marincola TaxID=578463 RepID=A0ABP3XS72_9FLAO
MLTRRHIRVKVMQSMYAMEKSGNDNYKTEEKFLLKSMHEMYDLFLMQLSLFVELKEKEEDYLEKLSQKHLATAEDKDPNRKFANNALLSLLSNSKTLKKTIESRKLNFWSQNEEYISIVWNAVRISSHFEAYTSSKDTSLAEDRNFIISIFKEVIAPNEKLYEFIEDYKLTWIDDLPIVNTVILKFLQNVKLSGANEIAIPTLFKNEDDKEFALTLFEQALFNSEEYENEIEGKTPNWDKERIAHLDAILIKLAICELLTFSSIPVKVTINEYLEIAKEYSTPKSSIFINGVIDKLSKEFSKKGKLNKIGRGLQ